MKEIINAIEKYPNRNVIQSGMDRLCSTYNPYSSYSYAWSELYYSVPTDIQSVIDKYTEEEHPYELINFLIMKYGRGERVIKYHVANKFLNEVDQTCLFEFNVVNSRLDFGRVNGSTHAYEIKSEIDKLDRLTQQMNDYEKVFEYLTVIIHESHLKEIRKNIKPKVGIIAYSLEKSNIHFWDVRSAKLNHSIQKQVIVDSLNGSELSQLLKSKDIKVPKTIKARKSTVNRYVPKSEVLQFYKSNLKKKYRGNWSLVKQNFSRILESDLQSMYSSGLNDARFLNTLLQRSNNAV